VKRKQYLLPVIVVFRALRHQKNTDLYVLFSIYSPEDALIAQIFRVYSYCVVSLSVTKCLLNVIVLTLIQGRRVSLGGFTNLFTNLAPSPSSLQFIINNMFHLTPSSTSFNFIKYWSNTEWFTVLMNTFYSKNIYFPWQRMNSPSFVMLLLYPLKRIPRSEPFLVFCRNNINCRRVILLRVFFYNLILRNRAVLGIMDV
jgi:hypothetical protein